MCVNTNRNTDAYVNLKSPLKALRIMNTFHRSLHSQVTSTKRNLFRLLHLENNCNVMVCLRWNWHLNWAWTSNYNPLSHLDKRITCYVRLWTGCVFTVHCSLDMFNVRVKYQSDIGFILIKPLSRHLWMKAFLLAVNLINFCQIFIPKTRCRKSIPIVYSRNCMCIAMLHMASDLEIDIDSISIKLWCGEN